MFLKGTMSEKFIICAFLFVYVYLVLLYLYSNGCTGEFSILVGMLSIFPMRLFSQTTTINVK